MGSSFTIIDNTGTNAIAGTFNGLPELSLLTISGVDFRITYKGGTGNDIVLTDNRTAPAYINSAGFATTLVTRPFSYTITAVNSPFSFSATGLPPGITIDPATGIISGSPTAVGVFSITLGTANANGNATATLTLTVQSTVVTNLFVASGDAKDSVSWDAVTGISSYNVKRSTNTGGLYTLLGNTTSLGYTDTTAANGAVYFYVVSTVDAIGENQNSAEVVAKPNEGQISYYPFDEPSGTKSLDYWGAKHGTLQSTAAHVYGKVNTALSLNGTATSYDILPAGIVSTLNDFTISAWVNMTSIGRFMRVFDFGNSTTQYMYLTPQSATTSNFGMRYGIRNGSAAEQNVTYTATSAFPVNTWVHLAVTQSGNTLSLYFNGVLGTSSNSITLKPSSLGITSIDYLGKSQFNDPMFNGAIDEFRIFNKALSASEINTLANPISLPVNFISISAAQKNAANEINWKMAIETGIDHYEVERSGNGIAFEKIGAVKASSATNLSYAFSDNVSLSARNYYRIKAVEISGRIKYSSIVSINAGNKPGHITCYPNPVVGNTMSLHFNNLGAGKYNVSLFDNPGKQVIHIIIAHDGGSANYAVPLGISLATGSYQLQINGGNKSEAIRIMINK